MKASFGNLLSRLMLHHSWKLEKISTTTFPRDITIKLSYIDDKQGEEIARMIRNGCCFRCRIAKGRYYFGATPSAAIAAALKYVKK